MRTGSQAGGFQVRQSGTWSIWAPPGTSEEAPSLPTIALACCCWKLQVPELLSFAFLIIFPGEMQAEVGASGQLSQQSPEQAVGKKPGWFLGKGSLEPREERGQVARHFSGSFALRSAGQKGLPGGQCLIAPQCVCPGPSGSLGTGKAWASETRGTW